MGRTVHDPEPLVAGREEDSDRGATKVYLVGGGIASLAAAVFLIRDGDVPGHNITDPGGTREARRQPRRRRIAARRLRPSRRADAREQVPLHLRSVLVDPHPRREQDGHPGDLRLQRDHEDLVEVPPLPRRTSTGCSRVRSQRETHPEPGATGHRARGDARQEQHRRPVRSRRSSRRISGSCGARPSPSSPGTARWSSSAICCGSPTWSPGSTGCEGIMRTVYNQYDSMVRPLQKWLDERGVRFELNTRVTDLGLRRGRGREASRAHRLRARRPCAARSRWRGRTSSSSPWAR